MTKWASYGLFLSFFCNEQIQWAVLWTKWAFKLEFQVLSLNFRSRLYIRGEGEISGAALARFAAVLNTQAASFPDSLYNITIVDPWLIVHCAWPIDRKSVV